MSSLYGPQVMPSGTVLALGQNVEKDVSGGMKADAILTDKLFRSPPDGYGLFKPRFFADNFTAEGLTAGDKNCETR